MPRLYSPLRIPSCHLASGVPRPPVPFGSDSRHSVAREPIVRFSPQVAQQDFARATWGPDLATPFCLILASSLGRSIQRVQLCGSKAGATFCLAMISIGSGLKPRASQRCRNNCLTLEMENGAPANLLGEPQRPPPWCVPGRGGWRAISRPQTELQYTSV